MQIAFIDGEINPFITGPALKSQLRAERAPIGIRGAMGARSSFFPAANLRGIER
ncbi:hypothetical protein [Paraburkholderia elongata]|uniref:Uncharacterized protein n=1 Tax=Paraburkholderia elongata TaxID=2675747 RepID=A0A972P2Z6_9BURK|nr:hypothetical protein [Paraburkholderia elongata]NPT62180.1 hypothetical protein [Paraburkholderia elongata]